MWVCNSVPLINQTVFMPILHGFYYYIPVIYLEIRNGDISGYSFIIQYYFSYHGVSFVLFLLLHRKLSVGLKELSWNFDRDCVGSVGCGRMAVFTMLILLMHLFHNYFFWDRISAQIASKFQIIRISISFYILIYTFVEPLIPGEYMKCFVRSQIVNLPDRNQVS